MNIPPIEERMKRLLIDAAQLRRPCKRYEALKRQLEKGE